MLSVVKKNLNVLFVAAALSYFIQMVIIPKAITMTTVIAFGGYLIVSVVLQQRRFHAVKLPCFARNFFPFILWVLVSVLWTINDLYSFALIRILLGFEFGVLVAFFLKKNQDVKSILNGFILGAFLSAVVVLYNQYYLIGIIRLGNEIYGSSMEFSGGLCVACYCCLVMWKIQKNFIYFIIFILFLILSALSGSRTAILYPIVFLALMSVIYYQKFTRIFYVIASTIIFVVIAVYACLNVPTLYDVVGRRIEAYMYDRSEDGSYLERKEMKAYAIELWEERILVGWGCHGFGKKFEQKRRKNLYSHCDYTEVLSCYGLIGAFLWYTPYLLLMSRKKMLMNVKNDWLQSFLLSMLVITVIGFFTTITFVNVKTMMLVSLMFECLNRKKWLNVC